MNELVLTPDGYVAAKQIKLGDTLIDRDGKPTKVVGVFPQGIRPCYKITFSDGRNVILDDNHLNIILDPHCRGEKIMTTKELFEKECYWNKKGNTAQIPAVSSPIVMPERKFIIPPYVMGVLLGDGCLITGVSISNPEHEIIERISKELPAEMEIKKLPKEITYRIVHKELKRTKEGYGFNLFTKYLREVGLFGKRSNEKFVPKEYLYASIQQRIDLLNGLMDTDGYATRANICRKIDFTSTSKDLAEAVVWLVESLGGKAWIKEKIPTFIYKGERKIGKKSYMVNVILKGINPFYLKRKADFHFEHIHTVNKVIKNIERVENQETVCFKVDSPTESFILRGQVVTHNSTVGALKLRSNVHKHHSAADNFLVLAPTYKILYQSTLKTFMHVFGELGKMNYSKGEYKIKNGPTIFFRSGHDPDSIVGITNVRGIWGDEAGLFSLYFWENIQARASFKQAQIILTTSPYSQNWVYKELIRGYEKGIRDDVCLIQATSKENPYFPDEEYERKRRTMDPRRFKMIYGGKFDKPEGLVYDNFSEDMIIDNLPGLIENSSIKYYGGIDWGHRDPFVLITRAVSCFGDQIDVNEFYKTGMRPSQIVEMMTQKGTQYHYERIWADPSRPDLIAELQSAGFPVVPANNDILKGIEAHYELIQQGRYKIYKSCVHTLDEYESYSYKEELEQKPVAKSKGVSKSEVPIDLNNHALDCCRYLSISLKNNGKKLTPRCPRSQ